MVCVSDELLLSYSKGRIFQGRRLLNINYRAYYLCLLPVPTTYLLRQSWNQEMMCPRMRRTERKRVVVFVVYDCHDMEQNPKITSTLVTTTNTITTTITSKYDDTSQLGTFLS